MLYSYCIRPTIKKDIIMSGIKIHNGGYYAHAQTSSSNAVKVGFVVCKGVFRAIYILLYKSVRVHMTHLVWYDPYFCSK